jgi:tetratricopeptide (TPR) repeat protein
MALRITGATATPAGPPPAAELSALATAKLSTGDIAGYAALYARAGEHTDPSRRYQCTRALIEQGLAAASRAEQAQARDTYNEVAKASVAFLEQDPREPVILGYAGVAFYELWMLEAARALFAAARRLDPALPGIAGNLAEVDRRRRTLGRVRKLPSWAPAGVVGLARRATELAKRAQPAQGLTLSLCMIVRDEEAMLGRCLEAAAPAVDEIIVVDTGSVDSTIEIAKSFGARVIEREWTGSFSEARNASFDVATSDWIIYLDADEVLISDDVQKLRALTGRTWREAFALVETSFTGGDGSGTGMTTTALRVFRNRPQYRFEGRIHEQISHRLPSYLPERLEYTDIRVEHYGYLGVVRDSKEKTRRNIELLEAQIAEGGSGGFLHYNLGSEYAAAGDVEAGLVELEKSWELVKADLARETPSYAPTLAVRLVRATRRCGRPQHAIERAGEGLKIFPGFTDLVFEQAWATRELGDPAGARGLYEQCIAMGDAPTRYGPHLGVGTYLPRLALAELAVADGRAADALELLRWCAAEHPEFAGAMRPFIALLLASGAAAGDAIAELERLAGELTPAVRYEVAEALHGAGEPAAAEEQFRQVLASKPTSCAARIGLAEALLSQRRYGEVAALAAEVPAGDELAASARRTELIARILDKDNGRARSLLAAAAAAGLAAEELEVFAGWEMLVSGAPAPALAATVAPVLTVLMDVLLRIGDYKAFEVFVGLLHASRVPPREQRELLARLYLKRGFLQSAAKEWMDVCAVAPDDRALVGLARVAAAHGLPEDAQTFAAEALALNPRSAEARALAGSRSDS